MPSFLCAQWQDMVPQGWLLPTQSEPKHQRMTGRPEGTSLRKSSSYFCQSIMRTSKRVQVARGPHEKQHQEQSLQPSHQAAVQPLTARVKNLHCSFIVQEVWKELQVPRVTP